MYTFTQRKIYMNKQNFVALPSKRLELILHDGFDR